MLQKMSKKSKINVTLNLKVMNIRNYQERVVPIDVEEVKVMNIKTRKKTTFYVGLYFVYKITSGQFITSLQFT